MPEKKQGPRQPARKEVTAEERRKQARGPSPSEPPKRGQGKDEADKIGGQEPKTYKEIEAEKQSTGRTAQGGPEGAEGVDWRDMGKDVEGGTPPEAGKPKGE